MKLLITILFLSILMGCKKKDTKPLETFTVTSYVKSGNGKLKVIDEIFTVGKNYTTTDNANILDHSIHLENTVKLPNDSINLSVTFRGVTKSQGMKLVNTIGNISFYLRDF